MLKTLSDEELEVMIEASRHLEVEPKGYRFVNLTLSVTLIAEVQRRVVFPEGSRSLTGADVLQMMRYIGASLYGLLAPQVFLFWGFKRDSVVLEVLRLMFKFNGLDDEDEMLNGLYYQETRVLQPIEDLDNLESFSEFLEQAGGGEGFFIL